MAEPEKSPSPSLSLTDIFDSLSPPQSRKINGQHFRHHQLWPALFKLPRKCHQCQPPRQHKKKKSPIDFTKSREKYTKYFQGNRILPIPELVQEVQPKIISFVMTDLKTRRLAGIKKETFEDLLKAAGIPAKYYCRRSFATWDVL